MLQPVLRPVLKAANDRLRGGSPIVLPEPPLFDLDFIGRPSLTYPGLPPLDFARADASTCATYRDSSGVRQLAAANVPRFDHDISGNPLGLLIEPTRTNYLLNSNAPATQTTGSLGTGTYTLWVEGSGSVTPSAGTATITGAGAATEGSPNTFTVTGAGTVDVTVTGTVTAFQLEGGGATGTAPSSLIVTAGATATRAAEICSLPLGSWFDATKGSLLWQGRCAQFANGLQFDDGTNSNSINFRVRGTGKLGLISTTSGSSDVNLTGVAATSLNTNFKMAAAWEANDFLATLDGETPVADTTAAVPPITTLYMSGDRTSLFHHGWYRRLTYWPRRLPAALLQALAR